ncbi:hypothetical protein Ndes2526B_g06545 [Nannochloris sp. 'desiccata']|nr:hypothetical protein KSW81_008280 [Chlorella desiccata (nom. nud.)]KAH7619565.1 putative Dihydroneopterin aldolase 1 [Chlorella desiccata (nom. nud.)]
MFRTSAKRLAQVARPGQFFHTTYYPMAATAPSDAAGDKILLKGLVFHGYHGVLEEERSLGQKFVINATLTANLQKAGKTDDLQDTINYAAVYTDIKTIVEGKPHLLIESVAEMIATRILNSHKVVEDVRIRVEKPHVAVEGVVESLGIEIFRTQKRL